MPNDHYASWERELATQTMEAELYFAGKRAGATAASAEWPQITSKRPGILSKAMRATQELFGREGAARNAGYYAGWVSGYSLRCAELEHKCR
ncbi:MAG: hypothetical protein IVW57_02150 [Ktedonobacterales bacterium]|nr:hypothetical protein [Ktedonobacterales bacterium]